MYRTVQEEFWAGQFVSDYIERNKSQQMLATKLGWFAKIISRTTRIESIIEFGSNIGLNLLALSRLLPQIVEGGLSAIEITMDACAELKKILPNAKLYNQSILDFDIDYKRDLVLISGVLIHINPDELKHVYKKLYDCTKKYLLVNEYYNPTPVEVEYRGHSGKLFKRDFAGEIMDMYPDLQLIDYGFWYHRDNVFPGSDSVWFLMQK